MKISLSIGLIDLPVKMHNRISEQRKEFRSSRYVAGTNTKAKQAWVDEKGQLCQTETAYEMDGKLVPVATVKEALKRKYGDQAGTLRNAVFCKHTEPPFPIYYDGSLYAVEFPLLADKRPISKEKLKIATYLTERLSQGEMLVARMTYSHGFGVSQRLIVLTFENGRLNARGALYPTDVVENAYANSEVVAIPLSDAERHILGAIWGKQNIVPDDTVSTEIASALATATGGEVVGIPSTNDAPTEASLLEMLGATA